MPQDTAAMFVTDDDKREADAYQGKGTGHCPARIVLRDQIAKDYPGAIEDIVTWSDA